MPQPQEAWFGSLEDGFARAVRGGAGILERDYAIGGLGLKLRFADGALAPLIEPALRHLASAQGPAASLTVLVFRCPAEAVPLPAAAAGFSPRGDVVGFNTERFKLLYQPIGSILAAFDAERALAIYGIGAPESVPLFERTAPMRGLFGWWMRRHGRQLVHGAAVGNRDGCVLLGGKNGSGKSNTALACLQAGLAYMSDDFCAIEPGPRPTAHSLYATARTAAGDLARLPFLEPVAVRSGDPLDAKTGYFLHPRYADRLPASRPVRAIVLPDVRERRPLGLSRVPAAAAMMALAPQTASLLPDAGGEVFENISAFVRVLPCYRLDLGSDVARVPAVIEGLLAANGTPRSAVPMP